MFIKKEEYNNLKKRVRDLEIDLQVITKERKQKEDMCRTNREMMRDPKKKQYMHITIKGRGSSTIDFKPIHDIVGDELSIYHSYVGVTYFNTWVSFNDIKAIRDYILQNYQGLAIEFKFSDDTPLTVPKLYGNMY